MAKLLQTADLRRIYGETIPGETIHLRRGPGGELVGEIRLEPPTLERSIHLNSLLAKETGAEASGSATGATIRLLVEAARECIPAAKGLDDEALWRLIQSGGGYSGAIGRSLMRLAYGIDPSEVAPPDPT